jgi:hypothetical protein
MSREALPDRRLSTTVNFHHSFDGGLQPLTATVSFYPRGDGGPLTADFSRPGEVFLETSQKASTGMSHAARDIGLLISIALQHGATIEEMRTSVARGHSGQAHSIAGSALDAVAAEMALRSSES